MSDLKPFNSKNIAYIKDFDVNDPKSLFIEASAGTGKTYTIQQIVARLIADGTELKRVLIVTYTEKAAGELKDRIRKKMEEVLETGKINKDFDPDAEDAKGLDPRQNEINPVQRRLFENALRDVDSAPIFTIHSFCQKALRDYAYEAGRPFDIGMISDDNVVDVICEWLRSDWIKKVQGKDSIFVEILNKKDSISDFIKDFAKKLAAAESKYKGNDNGLEIIVQEAPEPLKIGDDVLDNDTILEIYKANCYKDFKNTSLLKPHLDILEAHQEDPYNKDKTVKEFLDNIKEQLDLGKNLFNAGTFKISAFITDRQEQDLYASILELHKIQKSKVMECIGDYVEKRFLNEQVPLLFDAWQKRKIQNKFQSFDDMILSVRKNVLDRGINGFASTLCQKLRDEFKFAIIDEFQDTNQLQWDIFGTIFLGHDRKGIANHAITVVGDPKQSIYSFQGADVEVYKKAINEIGLIGNGYCLENNFRSTANMINACNALFDESKNTFFNTNDTEKQDGITFKDSKVGKPKYEPELYHEPADKDSVDEKSVDKESVGEWRTTKPLWISTEKINEKDFAKAAVERIIDWSCFVIDENGNFVRDEKGQLMTKLRIFDKDNESKPRNVTFKDFAVLARTRTEMPLIEEAMKKAGVPFVRYKDDKLFYGHECAQWIALFKALDAPNFSSYNRRILNEVLITDFFTVPLNKVEDECYDNPLCKERQCIAEWKKLAQKRRFAEMQERIYADSGVEDRLKDLSLMQSRAKFIQIGNYAINYLYSNVCTLNDVIHQLETLSKNAAAIGEEDKDGNLIGKATDADAVQVMTIHASKGLEFPIVISAGGWKSHNDKDSGPFLFHNDKALNIGFSKNAKDLRAEEEFEEWKRLYYVDFTRASSILILPHYEKMYEQVKPKKEYEFMVNALTNLYTKDEEAGKPSNAELFAETLPLATLSEKQLQEKVHFILDNHKNNAVNETCSEDDQQNAIKALASSMSKHCIIQHSYSNLGGKQEINVTAIDGTNPNKNGDSTDDENENKKEPSKSKDEILIDRNPVRIIPAKFCPEGNGYDEVSIKFPKGGKLGNAIHSIFELTRFKEFGLIENAEEALQHPDFSELVERQFKAQCFNIGKHPEWKEHAAEIIFNTLQAELPEIQGGSSTGKYFQLRELDESSRKAEMQFNFTRDANAIEASKHLHSICKGFIDLVFVRGNPGEERYSILDWKTDFLADSMYSFTDVQNKVDQEYSVQRVLYCYLLIKWLKQFFKDPSKPKDENGQDAPMSESDIFDKHFGGIYYAFVRGCKAGYSNGIYAQTWKNWEALEHEYLKNVTALMNKAKKKMDGETNE